jgi:hypothetical protein
MSADDTPRCMHNSHAAFDRVQTIWGWGSPPLRAWGPRIVPLESGELACANFVGKQCADSVRQLAGHMYTMGGMGGRTTSGTEQRIGPSAAATGCRQNITQAQAPAKETSPMKPASGHRRHPMAQSFPPNLPSRCSASAFRFLHSSLAIKKQADTAISVRRTPRGARHLEKSAEDASKCSGGAVRKCRSAMTAVGPGDSAVSCQGSPQ